MKKKLIEVALPLEAINKASAREKSIRHGHPSTLHLWWARRPLAAARAVIFAQMVDDPSAHPELFPTEEEQEKERQRLFRLIEELVLWENTTNEHVLNQARKEIRKSWRYTCEENKDHPRAAELFDPDKLPAFHDPFAGGGALPLEAQRLGLEAYASDLNPVAVLINKAMIEIPPKFANMPPMNPESRKQKGITADGWKGAQGLAEDVRYYGKWMRDEAEKRIGHLYPKIEITEEMAQERPDLEQYIGQKLTVIAWLWARTVKSPNPAFKHVDVPLVSTFMLATKAGKEAYVEPVIEGDSYRFTVKVGKPKDIEAVKNGTKLSRGANFKCLMSGTPIKGDYIKAEGVADHMGSRLMAIVAEGKKGRFYLTPTLEHEEVALQAKPEWKPENELIGKCRDQLPLYGINTFGEIFTPRQLVALTTLSDLVMEARERVKIDALTTGMDDGELSLDAGGKGAQAYADAVAVYLAFQVDQLSNHLSMNCAWHVNNEQLKNTFARQALAMTWDYAETNPFSNSTGSLGNLQERQVKGIKSLAPYNFGFATQSDASIQEITANKIVATDPPYYDNIGYADLSDFFYVWLRRSLRLIYPNIFGTLAVPKAEELVATPYRHGSKEKAEAFFLNGMTQAMHRLAEQAHPAFPVTIYYAFKQSETEKEGTVSTGWETFLEAVIHAGFALTGTWPMRTEQTSAMKTGTNALASSTVLVCRPQDEEAYIVTRREFLTTLKNELPKALKHLQYGNIAPVDLAQAAIGPGMAVYTRYSKVLDAEGKAMTVREALALINQTLDEVLTEQEGDFDADSRWALAWFEQYGFDTGEYGVAETLSKAKNTSVSGMVEAGILESRGGKVRVLRPAELPADWDPAQNGRLTVWEIVHHLIRVLESGGETAAAELVAKLGSKADTARELAYRLYVSCERNKRSSEALSYNALVQSWPEIMRLAKGGMTLQKGQMHLIEEE
ncbi:DUF1156 domain-containing protein [Methanomethylovorans sp.]|uniref:DUF1156 domain-containing protein n=1 Tax=Methanomethylovorans sp. TaxID=2758717 RepID=UPI000A3DB110|nr:DUF1156 domain-containing protein [Methanomethylovorans sp.]